MPLSSVEIKRRRALIFKLKEETVSQEETQELVSLLEKERCIAFEEGGNCMLLFAILSLLNSPPTVQQNFYNQGVFFHPKYIRYYYRSILRLDDNNHKRILFLSQNHMTYSYCRAYKLYLFWLILRYDIRYLGSDIRIYAYF